MAITTAVCNVAREAFLMGRHLSTDTFRFALYDDNATLGSDTTRYLTANEISGTGYLASGQTLEDYAATYNGAVAYLDFQTNPSWGPTSTFSARGVLMYNHSLTSKEALAAWDFGSVKEVSSGTFTIALPSPTTLTALLRIGS
jgi:hypothetical protein